MNLSDDNQIIYPGANVATMSSVTCVGSAFGSKIAETKIPPHLVDSYNRATENLDTTQFQNVGTFKIFRHIL